MESRNGCGGFGASESVADAGRPWKGPGAMGETYDFEFVPERRGNLRLEVRSPGPQGRLLVRAPIRVD
jgi:hypothetical protein